ncbi:MAG: hypothetical protein FK730_10315 [Asgard group archaeon]|nr:hypothetical protein [Asgard group archaeon]
MSVSIKTLEDYGFLLCFIGGILTVVISLLGFIINIVGEKIHWFLGEGYIGFANEIAGTVISMIFGILAIIIGLKLFSAKIGKIIEKIDLIIVAIIMLIIGIIAFGIGGVIIIVGGILVLIHRLQSQ